ncbi:hypothetical protein RQP46_001899 [Phenoliferia psychrophenolica]
MATFGSTYIPRSGDWILVKPGAKGTAGIPTDPPHIYQVASSPLGSHMAFKARRYLRRSELPNTVATSKLGTFEVVQHLMFYDAYKCKGILDRTDVVGRCIVLYSSDYVNWKKSGQVPSDKTWDPNLPLFWSDNTIANFVLASSDKHIALDVIYKAYKRATPGEPSRISSEDLCKVIMSHYSTIRCTKHKTFILGMAVRPVPLDRELVTWIRETYTVTGERTSLKEILRDARSVATFASVAREDLRDTLLAAFDPIPKTIGPNGGESISHMLIGVKRKIPLAPLDRAPPVAAPVKVSADVPIRAGSSLFAPIVASRNHKLPMNGPPAAASSSNARPVSGLPAPRAAASAPLHDRPHLPSAPKPFQESYFAQGGRHFNQKPLSAPAVASAVPASLATASSSSDKGKGRSSLTSDSGYATSSPAQTTPLNLRTLPLADFIEYMKTADPARARLYDAARVILDEEAIGSDVLLRVGQDKLEKLGIKIGVASRMLMELSVVE